MFSFPLIIILVDKKLFKQNLDHTPINLPPKRTVFCGISNVGKKIIEIKTIPLKKID